MNHIRKTQIALDSERIEKAALECGLDSIRDYVSSEKFWKEPYVNVQDILLRIREVRDAALGLRLEYENKALADERSRDEAFAAKPKRNCEVCGTFDKTWELVGSQGYGCRIITCKACRIKTEHEG